MSGQKRAPPTLPSGTRKEFGGRAPESRAHLQQNRAPSNESNDVRINSASRPGRLADCPCLEFPSRCPKLLKNRKSGIPSGRFRITWVLPRLPHTPHVVSRWQSDAPSSSGRHPGWGGGCGEWSTPAISRPLRSAYAVRAKGKWNGTRQIIFEGRGSKTKPTTRRAWGPRWQRGGTTA